MLNSKSRIALPLSDDLICAQIKTGEIGVYILGVIQDHTFKPIYVGRSDSCLRTRLLTHNHREIASHVTWKVCLSKKEAYNCECTYYHFYESEGFLNYIHPASPKGLNYECPICSNIYNDVS